MSGRDSYWSAWSELPQVESWGEALLPGLNGKLVTGTWNKKLTIQTDGGQHDIDQCQDHCECYVADGILHCPHWESYLAAALSHLNRKHAALITVACLLLVWSASLDWRSAEVCLPLGVISSLVVMSSSPSLVCSASTRPSPAEAREREQGRPYCVTSTSYIYSHCQPVSHCNMCHIKCLVIVRAFTTPIM